MEATSIKQPSPFARCASINVSQLDKINAIPNKITNNILMDNLCPEDQHYLSALMDNDSSEDEGDNSRRSSTAWSPMVQSPVMMNKRIKKLRPSYAITLSLEDMSYIRPSWGISKGLRTIELNKQKRNKKKQASSSESEGTKKSEKSEKSSSSNDSAYYYFLILLTIVVLFLTVPTYIVDKKKDQNKIFANKIRVSASTKTLEIYKPTSLDSLDSILRIQFGQGIPRDLKPDECTCEIYSAETRRYDPNQRIDTDKNQCYTCLDWATRANLRVQVEQRQPNSDSFCYNIKWQSYDTLSTPLVDCFILGDEQWFGIGDVPWPLNKLQFDWTTLVTNLSGEFSNIDNVHQRDGLNLSENSFICLGSYVNFSIFSTVGLYIGDVKTDFETSFKISQDQQTGVKKLCISVSCTDKCTSTWSRIDHLNNLKYHNNLLEYKICSSSSLKSLISKRIDDRTRQVADQVKKSELSEMVSIGPTSSTMSERMVERESKLEINTMQPVSELSRQLALVNSDRTTNTSEHWLPDGIGLIDRTIFATSLEFMPVLDGQTLRQYVDNIVKLGLKTSSILLIDTRWETFVGSLKLNIGMFPKSKLLFGLLHNKGFKIVFTIKPYIDTGIGINSINQLFESARLYSASYQKGATRMWKLTTQQQPEQQKESANVKGNLIRRTSLFTYKNQSIEIGFNDSTVKFPYLFRCKESQEGYCVLLDLTQSANRAWLVGLVRRSNLLISEADGIQIGGAHPNNYYWDDHYRAGVSELVQSLFYKERIYTLPQWTGDFNYIQLAPRRCDWDGLRSVVNSVLNLGMLGFSLIHPGSVWGDLKSTTLNNIDNNFKPPKRMESIYKEVQPSERSDEELITRWLQVAVFLPILQFNNIAPIERHNLHELVGNLVKIRKIYVVSELKKNLPFTPLISTGSPRPTAFSGTQLPLIRPVWYSQETGDTIIPEQFTIGDDILVAPILYEGLRQKDIYLPNGFWHDELRNINIRGGKWLRNYPIELSEIAWFTRARR